MNKLNATISAIVLGSMVAVAGANIGRSHDRLQEAGKKFAFYESAIIYDSLHLKYSSQANFLLEGKKDAAEDFIGNVLISAIGLGAVGYIFYRSIKE